MTKVLIVSLLLLLPCLALCDSSRRELRRARREAYSETVRANRDARRARREAMREIRQAQRETSRVVREAAREARQAFRETRYN